LFFFFFFKIINFFFFFFFFNYSDPLKITTSDIGYIFEEIWNGRSALSGNLNKLALTSNYLNKAEHYIIKINIFYNNG